MSPKHLQYLAQQLNISQKQIENTARLLEEGATVPFISRYRKETTGSLDEVAVAEIQKQIKKLKELEKRREMILESIESQGKLTDSLRARIESTMDATELEDLYLPYKKKRKTRASLAKEKGLEPLAKKLFEQREHNVESLAKHFVNNEVTSTEDALQGARDIMAEWINENEKARNKIRYLFDREAVIKSKLARGKEEQAQKYKDYFEYEEKLKRCPSHRLLAIRRGEEEGLLRVSISPDIDNALYYLDNIFLKSKGESTDQVAMAIEDAYKRLLAPSIETEFRALSKQKADEEAIEVFAKNLRQLLLAAPLGQKKILAIDPGFRTGCKTVCLDASGNFLHYSTIFPHPPQNNAFAAKSELKHLVKKYDIEAIAIGNGTAGRETLALCNDIQFDNEVQIFLVNENGASIYSASKIAREEFPNQDLTVRGAISIGRRLMDPLAELVKIDPKSIGVGQ
ncbi:MAG TPA: RNA-binding transcriptional accessory protein, partial [Phaeodactylibacter sp.]|nr:RNA-binding transcriptional accessory protein [Phaeodactylibacter sp.]